jgi:hypothetical protein
MLNHGYEEEGQGEEGCEEVIRDTFGFAKPVCVSPKAARRKSGHFAFRYAARIIGLRISWARSWAICREAGSPYAR